MAKINLMFNKVRNCETIYYLMNCAKDLAEEKNIDVNCNWKDFIYKDNNYKIIGLKLSTSSLRKANNLVTLLNKYFTTNNEEKFYII